MSKDAKGGSLVPFIKSLMVSPPTLTTEDLAVALRLIFLKVPSEIHIASFLTGLSLTKLDRDPKYISTAVKTILEFSDIPKLNLHPGTQDPSLQTPRIFTDIVGTGGDGQNTFNVSTSSAIVVAGIKDSGVVVTKHGGKASTSNSGAGDLITSLGIDTSKINANTIPQLVAQNNKFIFLFAPSFHGGMGAVAEVRKQLGIPSIFNILGPLLNPITLQSRVLGVFAEELGPIYAQTVKELFPPSEYNDRNSANKYRTAVVWGEVGLDEVSPIGKTKLWYIDPETHNIDSEYISPSDFGLPEHELDQVRSKSAKENAEYLKKILENKVPDNDPVYHYILLNSSLLAVSSGIASNWKEGVELAKASIKSGAALQALQELVNSVNKL